jgi:hypothetical protein
MCKQKITEMAFLTAKTISGLEGHAISIQRYQENVLKNVKKIHKIIPSLAHRDSINITKNDDKNTKKFITHALNTEIITKS